MMGDRYHGEVSWGLLPKMREIMTKSKAEAYLKKYGSLRKTSEMLGINFRKLKRILASKDPECVVVEKGEVEKPRNTISESELLADVDPETKVTVALMNSLRSIGKGQYMKDTDLRKECHAGDLNIWREVRMQKEFWLNVMIVGHSSEPMIYWGSPSSVESLVERGKARKPSWVKKETV